VACLRTAAWTVAVSYPAADHVTLGEWVVFGLLVLVFALSAAGMAGLLVASVVFVIRALRG
jgi:hypothetical protein